MQKDSTNLNKDNISRQQDAHVTLNAMDIENMPVILSGELREELSVCIPAPASKVIVTTEDFNDGNDDRLSENSLQVLHVTHKEEV